MAKVVADRVLETSTTTGTGALTLAGAYSSIFRAASAVCANGDTFDYSAEDPVNGGWETGLATWGTGNVLTRTTIYASSNAGAPVSWLAGTRNISLCLTAAGFAGSTWVKGLLGTVNATTPLTKYDLSADVVTLKNAQGAVLTVNTVSTKTCDFGLTGPAANARDQSAVFSINSWVQLFWIYNPSTTTIALIASTAAPTAAPALPSGYTYWCYATSLRWNPSSNLIPTYTRGTNVTYQVQQDALTNGGATVETAVSTSALVPPAAPRFNTYILFGTTAAAETGNIRLASGIVFTQFGGIANSIATRDIAIPNLSQNVYYLISAATAGLYIRVLSYTVSNGDA